MHNYSQTLGPSVINRLAQQHNQQQTQTLHAHLRQHHSQLTAWSDETLEQWISAQGQKASQLGLIRPK